MLAKLQGFMNSAMLHLGALVVLWVLLVTASYGMARWCFKREIEWQKIIKWISICMAAVFGSVAALDFLPEKVTAPLIKVLVPYLVCAAALHSFLLAIDRYMRHRYSEGIIQTRLVVAVISVYVFAILLALLVLKLDNLALMTLSNVGVGYLTRIAILGLLGLEIFGGRCKDNQEEQGDDVNSSGSYTSRW